MHKEFHTQQIYIQPAGPAVRQALLLKIHMLFYRAYA